MTEPDSTLEYYDRNAGRFFDETIDLDMIDVIAPFLEGLPAGGRVLDAGCGSGRDSLYFKNAGYQVMAMDASKELAARASCRLGQPVLQMTFLEMDFCEAFDGIWACASILHVPRTQMNAVLERLERALKPGGMIYASFKYGEGETIRGGRLFNNYNEASLRGLLAAHRGMKIERLWTTQDRRPLRKGEFWLNVVLKKF